MHCFHHADRKLPNVASACRSENWPMSFICPKYDCWFKYFVTLAASSFLTELPFVWLGEAFHMPFYGTPVSFLENGLNCQTFLGLNFLYRRISLYVAHEMSVDSFIFLVGPWSFDDFCNGKAWEIDLKSHICSYNLQSVGNYDVKIVLVGKCVTSRDQYLTK